MVKWVFLLFVIALALSGWFASMDSAPGWAPVMPTLVIAAGIISGLVYAIRWGQKRGNEMAATAGQLGFSFEKYRPELRESGIGILKQFVHCRPKGDLSFLHRGLRTSFANSMTTRTDGADVFLFDYSTSRGKSVNYHGFFAAFHTPGRNYSDLEIVPRLWGEQPEWMRYFTDIPPARSKLRVSSGSFTAEYLVYAARVASGSDALSGDLVRELSKPGQSGWRVEMAGDWLAVTRLAPGKKIGGLADPMEPEKVSNEDR